MSDFEDVRKRIEAAFADRKKVDDPVHRAAVVQALLALDRGELRVAEKKDGEWKVNAWLMQAVNLFFAIAAQTPTSRGRLLTSRNRRSRARPSYWARRSST